MVDINLAEGFNDDNLKIFIQSYGFVRDRLPRCNCRESSTSPTCTNRRCIQATTATGGSYTKLDRTLSPILDKDNNNIPLVDLDGRNNDLNEKYYVMYDKLISLRTEILTSPAPEKIADMSLLQLFYDEISFLIS
jgi:hypothetical protein